MLTLLYPSIFFILFEFVLRKRSLKQHPVDADKIRFMYTFDRFCELPAELQIDELVLHGISLDLSCSLRESEGVLFAYHDFYIEMVVVKHTDDILCLNCFKNLDMLEPYLEQINIGEVAALLAYSR